MMLYFIDGEKNCSNDLLVKHGLTDLVPLPQHRQYLSAGPGGKSGIVISNKSIKETPKFVADQQTWVPRFGRPGSYVGYWKDRPPGPSDLICDDPMPGESVKLADGNQWTIPLIRQWHESDDHVSFETRLRTILSRCPVTGIMIKGPVVESRRELWDRSCRVAENLIDQLRGGRVVIEPRESDAMVAEIFGINYRIGLDELSLLGLLTDSDYPHILFTALDLYRFRELVGNVLRRRVDGTPQPSDTDCESGELQPSVDGVTSTDQP